MPPAKTRSSKRTPGGTSCSSTGTTVVFISLCALGVWMLSSNDLIPTQTTTTTTSSPILSEDSDETKKPSSFFEDNPGHLPEDAVKTGDVVSNQQQQLPDIGLDKSIEDQKNALADNLKNSGNMESMLGNVKEVEGDENGETQQQQLEKTNQEEETTSVQDDVVAKSDAKEMKAAKAKERKQKQEQAIEKEETFINDNQEIINDQTSAKQPQKKDVEEIITQLEDEQQQSSSQPEKQEQKKQTTEDDIIGTITSDQTERGGSDDPPMNNNDELQTSETESTIKKEEEEDKEPKKKRNSNKQSKSPSSSIDGGSKKQWKTQTEQSVTQKVREEIKNIEKTDGSITEQWKLCNTTANSDYIPCLDNEAALKKLRSRGHYEHRERHCPEEGPTCLVPLPEGYKVPVTWPKSRDKIWYHNVPHTKLAEVKGHQNWVKVSGEYLTFPGGGTQFIHGALHYIDFIEEAVPEISWGKHTRVVLDVGCGVASFGGFLFERDVVAMSFAPKDEHEAQVQFALERGIPAISAVMGTLRLPFPSRVFDLVHCARCRVPWHIEGGALLLELNRVLRPGGYFVWSATPVYQTLEEDVEIWREMSKLTAAMCWKLVTIKKDKLNSVGAAVYHKPTTNECYDQRKENEPPLCKTEDDPNAAWYVPLHSCMHRIPEDEAERGSRWPESWPRRLQTPPFWLIKNQKGIYGKTAPEDFARDNEYWKQVVGETYLNGQGISWANVRNVMDMRATYGGFAAALKDLKIWVMNVVNTDAPDTLSIIYERGLFGIYHDWCESFSTYPRSYDLVHADRLFSSLRKRCDLTPVVVEIDRIVRPGGKLIVRDDALSLKEVEKLLDSLHWKVKTTPEGALYAQKTAWRPDPLV
ncbi:probable methyltransferase PMT27 [Impatiens glandulifera]|uniref:probable methyltransferase PMT27 n=1 Tax=Impatiens glandulifera TaxID=253017 RepID=UPI001FB0C22F|nr:probable methyltransferase PMT27 [Impatiens glandulifera]